MKKKIFGSLGFGIVLILLLFWTKNVFSFKYGDGIYGMKKFYEQEEGTVDVLILGPSLAFADINTATLWSEYGISAFHLCGSIQPMWNTYYYMKEALKYQRPKVMILEASVTNMMSDYSDQSRIIKNTYGMKWSKDKLDAIRASAPREQWNEYLFEHLLYHSRYEEISRADFLPDQGSLQYEDWKGFMCLMKTVPQEGTDVSHVKERSELSGKTEEYYRKTIELAKEEGIPLLIVVSPHAGISEWSQTIYNTAADIAGEYEVPFINYNLCLEEIGLDYSKYMADPMHLNYKGNQKYTRNIAKYLSQRYNLTDHRGDERYDSWERNSNWYLAAMSCQEIVECTDLTEMTSLLQREDLDIVISVDGTYSQEDGNLRAFLQAFQIPSNGETGIWIVSEGKVDGLGWGPEQIRQIPYPYHVLTMKSVWSQEKGQYTNSVSFDTTFYKQVENGINVVLCSKATGELVDSFGILAGENEIYR